MTLARLLTSPPEGHGITGRMLDKTYAELTSGRNLGSQLLAVGIMVPVGTSQRRTAKGVKRFVTYEFLRLEPILDPAMQEELRFALTKAYERRTSGSKQMPLEFDGAPELEKRREIFAALAEWREDQEVEVTQGELEAAWRDYIQPVEGATVPAMAHADTQALLQFAYHIGAIALPTMLGMQALPDANEGMPDAVRPVPEALFDDGQGESAGDDDESGTDDGGEPGEGSIEAAAAEAAEDRGNGKQHLKAVDG